MLEKDLPKNIERLYQRVSNVTPTGVVLENGEELKADAIVMCTGYQYTFPFLQGDCKLDVTEGRVTPLWKHIVHATYPTMFAIGIPTAVNPFPLFDVQTQFAVAFLTKSDMLPSGEQMERSIEKEFQEKLSQGKPAQHAHRLGCRGQWLYLDDLADLGGFPKLRPVLHKLFSHIFDHAAVNKSMTEFKNTQYRITGEDSFEEL